VQGWYFQGLHKDVVCCPSRLETTAGAGDTRGLRCDLFGGLLRGDAFFFLDYPSSYEFIFDDYPFLVYQVHVGRFVRFFVRGPRSFHGNGPPAPALPAQPGTNDARPSFSKFFQRLRKGAVSIIAESSFSEKLRKPAACMVGQFDRRGEMGGFFFALCFILVGERCWVCDVPLLVGAGVFLGIVGFVACFVICV
jgi:hypothetical protein